MLSRRVFLKGCAATLAAAASYSLLPDYGALQKLFDSVPVLLYHRVGTDKDDLTVSVEHFRRDMDFLAHSGYRTLSLAEVSAYLSDRSVALPPRSIMITFDDGYLDNYQNAFPILTEYGLTASFYIISGMLDEEERVNAAQIREMQRFGMDFGSHTVTHRPLGELSAAEAKAELSDSRETLQDLLGKAVDFVAYPCGSHTEETMRIVREIGYCGGFSTRSGFTVFSNHFSIRRIPIFHLDRPVSYVLLKKGFMPFVAG